MHISGTATYASRAQEIQLDQQNRITCHANGILKAGNSINVSGSWLQHRWRRFHTYSSTTTYIQSAFCHSLEAVYDTYVAGHETIVCDITAPGMLTYVCSLEDPILCADITYVAVLF